jgi:hypothetical protein
MASTCVRDESVPLEINAVCAPRAVAETFEVDALLLARAVDPNISMLHPHWRKVVEDHLASAQLSGLLHILKVQARLARVNGCTTHYLVWRADGKSITNTSTHVLCRHPKVVLFDFLNNKIWIICFDWHSYSSSKFWLET